jgi:hypothetical protein
VLSCFIVEIYSVNGKKVYQQEFDSNTNIIHINDLHLTDSLYIVGVIYDHKVAYSKLFIDERSS